MVLSGMSQIMLTLSRLAQDLIIFTMPEFNYFILPDSFCTGSSIMPQKNNPDVCELVRAKSSRVKAAELMVYDIVKASPSGYNRDLQEAKEPFIDGISITRSSLTIMSAMLDATKINKGNLIQGFTKDVFATDFALELVADGVPFRDAYQSVKENLDSLSKINPIEAVQKKTHTGAPLGLNWKRYQEQLLEVNKNTKKIKRSYEKSITSLMGIPYEVR
jgi:argininosuccinate lyase